MKKYIKFIPYGILSCIIFLSLGYATFSSKMTISGITASVRPEENIRVTSFYAIDSENEAQSQWEEFSVNRISTDVMMPHENSTVSYKIQITNLGGISMSVTDIIGLPENMEIVYADYKLGETLCDSTKNVEQCKYGAQDEFTIMIKYKDGGFDIDKTYYELRLNLVFDCVYRINYYQLLPDEYQEVEYIESTGTQRINTGYIPKTNTKMELDLSFSGDFDVSSGSVGTGTFFYSFSNGSVFSVNFGENESQGNILFTWFDKNQADGGAVYYYDITDTIRTNRNTVMYEKGVFKYGTIEKNVAVKTENHTNPLYLFGTSDKNFDRYNMKVYQLKFFEDGLLKSDYIPCYRISDGVVGLYELVEGTFYPNIGTGDFNKGDDVEAQYHEVASQDLVYDVSEKLDTNTYTKEGYKFVGWNTMPDGSGLSYTDEEEVLNLSTSNGDEINLYAMWKGNSYTITYDTNGGTLDTTVTSVVYGDKYGNLPIAEKLGYKFGGWYQESNFINKIENNSIVNISSDHTLYAKWILAPVAINNVPTITMTQDQAKEYYGQVVSTVNGTEFDPNSSDSRIWRVFYIDTENKYGDGKGTIYLKADEVSSKTTRFSTTYEASNTSGYSSKFNILSTTRYYKISGDNIVNSSGTVINTLYLKLNPTYAVGRKKINSTILYEQEKSAAYLCDSTQFTAYTDERTNYAVGSPPIEMWIDSWNSVYGNQYKFSYQYNVQVDGTTGAQKLPGYQLRLNSGDWGQALGVDEIDINTIDTIGLYKTSIGLWIASPAIVYGGGSLIRISPAGFVGNATINALYAYSPVVSLNSESFVITTSQTN